MDYHEVGIFFDLKETSRKNYAAEAWEIFMKHCNPEMLKNSQLFHGETPGLLPGTEHLFCIAVRTLDLMAIQYLKELLGSCEDTRLAPPWDRFRETDIISKYQLKYMGQIDSMGRMETESWSRIDHDLCKAMGWPYFPHTRPPWLSEEQNRELDMMSEPGYTLTGGAEERKPGLSSGRIRRRPGSKFPMILKRVVWCATILVILMLAGVGWVNRERYGRDYHEKVEAWKKRRALGADGYARLNQGFAILNMTKVPPELPLDKLNKRLEERGYYVLQCRDESLVDGSLECSVWFSENQVGSERITQGFVSVDMREQNRALLWTDLAKGTVKLSELGKEAKSLRHESLLAAIDNLDLLDLPDGRAVRHYQKEGGFVQSRIIDSVSVHMQEVAERKLQAEILKYMSEQWIMSQRLHLVSGSTRDVIVLGHEQGKVWVKTRTGRMNIPVNRIGKVESFDEEMFMEQIGKVLTPLRKDFAKDWQHELCDELVCELSKKFVTYGPAYPKACVVCVRPNEVTGELEAVVKTRKAESTVKKGMHIDGFEVIGMDAESSSVLMMMGEGGEILRIWPEPAPEHEQDAGS